MTVAERCETIELAEGHQGPSRSAWPGWVPRPGYARVRVVFFIPSLVPLIVTGFLLKMILNPVWGIVDKALRFVGLVGSAELSFDHLPEQLPALGTLNVVRTMNRLSLTDTLYALIIVYAAIGIPFGVLIFTGFIREIPEELSNAARIDGAGDFGILRRVILPNLRPAIAATAIINTLPIWNDFWFPLILISSDAKKTFPLATANLFGQYQTDFGLVFAALSLASLPMILVYLLISKQYLRGIEAGALKG